MGDDARPAARPPGDDRVQPPAAGEAADDVGRSADRSGTLVGAGRRQPPDGRDPTRGVNAEDLVELARRVPPAEQVHGAAELDRGPVVERSRQPRQKAIAAGTGDSDRIRGDVRGREAAGEEYAGATDTRSCCVLHRRIQLGRAHDSELDRCRRFLACRLGRRSADGGGGTG